MLYLLALLLPPLAVLLCGKPFQALVNLLLCFLCLYVGGVIHAFCVVLEHKQDRRHDQLIRVTAATAGVGGRRRRYRDEDDD